MPVIELAKYMLFQLSQANNSDPVVKALTVEELVTVVKMQMVKLKLEGDIVPSDYLPLIQYYIKKDIYWKLATATAPLNKIELDGIKLEKQNRFEHYYELITQNEADYQTLLNNPSMLPDDGNFGARLKSIDTIVDKPYCRDAYLQTYKLPKISVMVDKLDTEFIYISINLGTVQKEDYLKTIVRSLNSQIMDEYANTINNQAIINNMDYDVRRTKFKIPRGNVTNILVQVMLKNGLSTYYELGVEADVIS